MKATGANRPPSPVLAARHPVTVLRQATFRSQARARGPRLAGSRRRAPFPVRERRLGPDRQAADSPGLAAIRPARRLLQECIPAPAAPGAVPDTGESATRPRDMVRLASIALTQAPARRTGTPPARYRHDSPAVPTAPSHVASSFPASRPGRLATPMTPVRDAGRRRTGGTARMVSRPTASRAGLMASRRAVPKAQGGQVKRATRHLATLVLAGSREGTATPGRRVRQAAKAAAPSPARRATPRPTDSRDPPSRRPRTRSSRRGKLVAGPAPTLAPTGTGRRSTAAATRTSSVKTTPSCPRPGNVPLSGTLGRRLAARRLLAVRRAPARPPPDLRSPAQRPTASARLPPGPSAPAGRTARTRPWKLRNLRPRPT